MTEPDRRTAALLLAVTPLLTLNVSYVFSVNLGFLPSCIPYIDGCTSTSSTGRALIPRMIFLPGMLLTSLLVALFWWQYARKFVDTKTSGWSYFAITAMGIIAGCLLAIYSILIGQAGDNLQSIRRLGSNGYFVLNYAAQILFLVNCRRSELVSQAGKASLIILVTLLPALAIAGEIAKNAGIDRHASNNIVEWNGIVLVCLYYAAVGLMKKHGSS